MKQMKKLFAMVLCMMMVLSMALPVAAEDAKVSLKINHIANNHTFTAYQIFDGDLTDAGVLSNVTWGTGITNGDNLIAALKADTTQIYNSDKTQSVVIKDVFAGVSTAAEVAEVIKDWSTNGERLDYLAEVLGGYLDQGTASSTVTSNGDGSYAYTISDLDPGYYLIKDTTANVDGEDYSTKYMIYLTTTTEMTTKGDFSTVEKTVGDTLDGTYKESIDNQLNKTYYYKWEAELDDELAWYETYKLQFTDTMSAGMTFGKLEEVYVLEVSGDKVYLYKDGAWVVNAEAGIDGEPTTFDKEIDSSTGKTTIVLGWNDIKTAYKAIAGDDKLVVKYSATLNENAVYGAAGNPNEVYIDFSNSPSDSGEGTSASDDAIAFTFQLQVLKADADNHNTKLEGAEFKLYHLHGTEKHYAVVDENGKITSWTKDVSAASVFVTNTEGKFDKNIAGLDSETLYYLQEVKAPAGYNLMFTDVNFSIHPNYITGTDGKVTYDKILYRVDGKETTLTAGEEFAAGLVTVTVLNDSGTTLPSTGGIGTTLFYVFGGILVVAAVVLLITKKRMSNER